MDIALFDLDHTLLPFDSGSAFTRYLAAQGALPAGFEARYLAFCQLYVEGRVDIVEMHGFTVGALAVHDPATLARWLGEFRQQLAPRIPPAALRLVRQHREAGHVCALVTATTRFIAEACGRALGLEEVLATEPELAGDGRYTGAVVGPPCFAEHKLTHVKAWLARRGLGWNDVDRSWFYSDSVLDLPLLEAVTYPVAIDPDPRLKALALRRGWPVRSLLGALPQ